MGRRGCVSCSAVAKETEPQDVREDPGSGPPGSGAHRPLETPSAPVMWLGPSSRASELGATVSSPAVQRWRVHRCKGRESLAGSGSQSPKRFSSIWTPTWAGPAHAEGVFPTGSLSSPVPPLAAASQTHPRSRLARSPGIPGRQADTLMSQHRQRGVLNLRLATETRRCAPLSLPPTALCGNVSFQRHCGPWPEGVNWQSPCPVQWCRKATSGRRGLRYKVRLLILVLKSPTHVPYSMASWLLPFPMAP